jgi:hypothetical protein
MEHVHIAALQPNLDALESKQIKAVVTLIWPYSSSQRQFALLLAEPDFRLRRKRGGQVRVRFSSTSARALAATGVGIGDEVVLSLHGARFAQDGAVSTPGKSIDWELAYTQTFAISVRRDGVEIANLEMINAVPTPAPRSPVKRAAAAPSPFPQWSSPAFLKRARLSDGPFFEQPAFDPLADAYNEGHDKKRRRKSYRDWTAWKYTTRTPSPEKEDVALEGDSEEAMSSPSRRPQLPKTPISPSRTEATSVAAEMQEDLEYVEETTIADSADGDTTVDDGELQKVYAPLSTSPQRPHRDTVPQIEYSDLPLDSQYDFGGDTELNTEDEDEDEEEDVAVPEVEAAEVSATEVATDLGDELEEAEEEHSVMKAEAEASHLDASAAEEDREAVVELQRPEEISEEAEETTIDETLPEVVEPAKVVEDALTVAMPPPSLPALHTDFTVPASTELLTPIGRAPSSPNLQAVDSATLPLPSPFPGEQSTSYFEQVLAGQQQAPLDGLPVQDQPVADDDTDYIMENSFFSSISSSRAGGTHQDHETAFTPVRFTFGMDGAGWSRPLDLSSPPPEDAPPIALEEAAPTAAQDVNNIEQEVQNQTFLTEQSDLVEDVSYSSLTGTFDGDITSALRVRNEIPGTVTESVPAPAETAFRTVETEAAESAPISSNVVGLPSDEESEDGENEVDSNDEVMVEPDEEHSTEEDTASESEDEAEAESESESESEVDEVDVRQASTVENREHREPDNTASRIEPVDKGEPSRSPKDDTNVATQTSAAVSEVVDLESPSGGEGSEVGETYEKTVDPGQSDTISVDAQPVSRTEAAGNVGQNNFDPRIGLAEEVTDSTIPENCKFDDFIAANVTQQPPTVRSSSPSRPIRKPASITIPDTYEESPSLAFDDWEPQLGMDEPLPFIEDHDLPRGTQIIADDDVETADVEVEAPVTQHDAVQSDIKMESIEDGPTYLISQSQDVPQESVPDPATELMIAIPENGHKLREHQFEAVPATAPARNTRSKAKSAASPTEEDGYVSNLSTSMRRTRSKASFDSTNRDTASPTQSRGPNRSTATPTRTRDATQISPYSLRSQSKQLSPEQGVTASRAPTRKSPRKLIRRDTDFDIVPSQVENRDLFGSMFEPSQELGIGYSQLSQGTYSDVGFVKDSEEDTSHSEGSISTVQYSDDDEVRADLNDPAEVDEDVQPATPQLKPPPSFLQSSRQTRSRSRSMGQQSAVSPVQPPHSPRRSPRLTRSTFSPTPSPRVARTTRAAVQVSSPVPEAAEEDQSEEETPKAREKSISYPELPAEGEGDLRSSPPVPHSAQQSNLQERNLPTPDGTQQTAMEPPLSFQPRQPEQSLLITPDFTQQSSAAALLRSFDIPLPGVETQPAPQSPILRTSPRRKPAIASPKPSSPAQQSSPVQQSSDAISAADESATLVTNPSPPSIGLSTPLAYYTPLRDLIYFLNRSSQFHSSTNPDILALCTSPSISPSKANKGPRHWTTTLHITDLSIWPQTRTVQCFRAYATALPAAEAGDVVLLSKFKIESRLRVPLLRSVDESSWCVWRYGKPVWGKKGGKWGELRAREEVKGPVVERGVGEWAEVENLRAWYVGIVKGELERLAAQRESGGRELRSSSKAVEVDVEEVGRDE